MSSLSMCSLVDTWICCPSTFPPRHPPLPSSGHPYHPPLPASGYRSLTTGSRLFCPVPECYSYSVPVLRSILSHQSFYSSVAEANNLISIPVRDIFYFCSVTIRTGPWPITVALRTNFFYCR